MSSRIIHLEYSRCNVNHDIWSTPDVVRDCHLEFLSKPWTLTLKHSRCHLELYIWSTPDVLKITTSGVLQMLSEIDIWSSYPHQLWSTPDVIWSYTSGVLQMSSRNGDLEYSRCLFKWYIWSTPDVISGVHIIPSANPNKNIQIYWHVACVPCGRVTACIKTTEHLY